MSPMVSDEWAVGGGEEMHARYAWWRLHPPPRPGTASALTAAQKNGPTAPEVRAPTGGSRRCLAECPAQRKQPLREPHGREERVIIKIDGRIATHGLLR